MGNDFSTFATGLRAALRQAPKIVLVGEMRDRETVEIGLSAAETGHLVLSTLHTIDAGQTINRILGMFEPEEQEQIRMRLSDTLRWVISQRLVPRVGGGRHGSCWKSWGPICAPRTASSMARAKGRASTKSSRPATRFGWRNFDQACLEAYEQNLITEETALLYCSKRGVVARGIDTIKKSRGERVTQHGLENEAPIRPNQPGCPNSPPPSN